MPGTSPTEYTHLATSGPIPMTRNLSGLENAILETVAYADVFDYPLTLPQLNRYLHRQAAGQDEIYRALTHGQLIPGCLSLSAGFVMLAGREALVSQRLLGIESAAKLYPAAAYYGKQLSRLPFVRMVALTGSLAMGNADKHADFDYFIVTDHGHVWTSRAMCLLIAKAAKMRGYSICPNFIISRNLLTLPGRDIYNAHELTQMIPLAGFALYQELRRLNSWSAEFLPNALGPPDVDFAQLASQMPGRLSFLAQKSSEWFLRTRIGDKLEMWEMKRKIHKFEQLEHTSREVHFSANWCQGHFDSHGEQTLKKYRGRLDTLRTLPGGFSHE